MRKFNTFKQVVVWFHLYFFLSTCLLTTRIASSSNFRAQSCCASFANYFTKQMTDAADTTSIEPANAEQLQPDTPTMSVLKKAFPYMVVFGDIIIFVFEFIFLNTLIQLLLTNVSFIRQSRDSSVNVC
jgi:hypothetical protein